MIAELLPGAYDTAGTSVWRLSKRRHRWFAPNAPLLAYLRSPSSVTCGSLEEIRAFLLTCTPMRDQEQFGRRDYWMTASELEKTRRGDCEDFALWVWPHLLALGFEARFVCGAAGHFRAGHAWVTFRERDRHFLLEPMLASLGPRFPRLSTLRYRPLVSVSYDGERCRYYQHQRPKEYPGPFADLLAHVPEWLSFWPRKLPLALLRRLFRHRRKSATVDPSKELGSLGSDEAEEST